MNKSVTLSAFVPSEISMVAVDDLAPFASNARTHSENQIAQLAGVIDTFGWTNPVLINADGGIIAGHGRVLAAQQLGMAEVPCIRLTHLTPDQERALILADNRIAQNAGWDEDLLRQELAALSALEFDIPALGFDMAEIDRLLKPVGRQPTDPDDAPPPPADPVSQRGDVWIMGDHRVMCGSSTDPDDVARAAGDLTIDIACSDPPYGIKAVKGSGVHGRGRDGFGKVHGRARRAIIEPGEYAPIIGDDTTDTAVAHYQLLAALKVPIIVLWGGNYYANAMPPSRCWLVWDKENSGSFADAELAWTNQDKVVKLLRHQWNGLIKASERGQKRVHPTQKPVALAEWVVETLAPDAKVMFDGFLGSGWTLIAAQIRGIACVGVELSPAYVDVAVARWQTFTGEVATLESTGQTFAEVEAERHPTA